MTPTAYSPDRALLVAAAIGGGRDSALQQNPDAVGVLLQLIVSGYSTGNVVLNLQGRLPDGVTWATIASTGNITADGTYILQLSPGGDGYATSPLWRPGGRLPRIWRASVPSGSATVAVWAELYRDGC